MRSCILSFLLSAAMLFCIAPFTVAQSQLDRKYDYYFLEAMMERERDNHSAAFDLLQRCRELRPQASETLYFLAEYYTRMKADSTALTLMEEAVRLEPDNMTYLSSLSYSYITGQRLADATRVVEHMYETDKSRQELLTTLYRLYVQQERYDEAISVLNRLELIDGKSEQLSLGKSGLYLQMDRKEEALAEVKALAEKYPADLNYSTLYAQTLMVNDHNAEAYDILQRVLKEEPNNTRAQIALRNYYINENDTLQADSITERMLFNPDISDEDRIMLIRQEIQTNEAESGDSTVVLKLFHRILDELEPSADIAEMCAAYMDIKQMPRDSIKTMLRRCLDIAPDQASARFKLVQYAVEEDDRDTMMKLCSEARQYNPEEIVFYYFQGIGYYQQDDVDRALDTFQQGLGVKGENTTPELLSDFYLIQGDLLHQKGRNQEAYASYDSCLSVKPDNIGCLNNYAYFLSCDGIDLDKAELMSHKAIKAEPDNATYLDTYAWILFMKAEYDDALKYIDRAVACDSDTNAVLLEHQGDIYVMVGRTDEAVTIWQRALEKDPANRTLKRKIKKRKFIKPDN